MNNDLIKELGLQVKSGQKTWQQASNEFNQKTGQSISGEAIRKRYANLNDTTEEKTNEEYETHYQNGTIELQKEVFFDEKEEKTPESILRKFGYSPDEWTLIEWRFGKWEVAIKDEEQNRVCTTIRAKIKPKTKEHDPSEYLEIVKELFSKEIKPFNYVPKQKNDNLNNNKLMECPPIELHLGELSCWIDTGENYDQKIAQERFKKIISEIVSKQEEERCGSLLLNVGGDFFNSDTVNDTTTKGTQQHNDVRWKKMFLIGVKLWVEAIELLDGKFNKIDVQLIPGNHDYQTSHHLFVSLQLGFRNRKNINFIEDYKSIQCYTFGDCMIAITHGSKNVNRTLDSIPGEFSKAYGKTKFREVHFGHLHSEQELKERLGIVPRRISTPKGIGTWEYDERYGNTIAKHQLFVWQKGVGLIDIKMIPFQPVRETNKKKLIKTVKR